MCVCVCVCVCVFMHRAGPTCVQESTQMMPASAYNEFCKIRSLACMDSCMYVVPPLVQAPLAPAMKPRMRVFCALVRVGLSLNMS